MGYASRLPEAAIPRSPQTAGLFYALSAYLAWGLSPIYFKALRPSGPLEILSWRVVASVALLGVMTVGMGRGAEVARSLSDRRRALTFVATTLLISCNWVLYIWSVNSGHLLEASMGYFMNPLVTILLGVVFLKEGLDRRQKFAVGLAAVGVVWLVVTHGKLPWISLVLAITFALYALLRKKARIDAVAGLLVETALLAPLALGWLVWLWWRGEAHFGTSTGMSVLLLSAGAVTALPARLVHAGRAPAAAVDHRDPPVRGPDAAVPAGGARVPGALRRSPGGDLRVHLGGTGALHGRRHRQGAQAPAAAGGGAAGLTVSRPTPPFATCPRPSAGP